MGFESSDDAAVYALNETDALIQTVDFFPPMVDDPYTFGQAAAANALSDVWAMGGEPRLCLNLLAVPACLPGEAVKAILAGGADKVAEAGAILAGGHSIEDKEPKYGLCVTGFVRREDLLRNSTARVGDLLVLTKPLGSGVLSTAGKAELLTAEQDKWLTAALTALNRGAWEAMTPLRPNACTDVTGFGLVGHALEMAKGCGRTVELWAGQVPLGPGVEELAREGILPAGVHRNRAFAAPDVAEASGLLRERADALYDPQTAGGLLIALPEERGAELLRRLADRGLTAAVVGRVKPRGERAVELKP